VQSLLEYHPCPGGQAPVIVPVLAFVLGCCFCAIAMAVTLVPSSLSSTLSWPSPSFCRRSHLCPVALSLSPSVHHPCFRPGLSLPLSTCQIALIVPTTPFLLVPFIHLFPRLFSVPFPIHLSQHGLEVTVMCSDDAVLRVRSESHSRPMPT
jgi:hypothetical protein